MRCGQKINYDADLNDPDSFNAGHIKAWATHPDLREDPANFQQEHKLCNQNAGADDAAGPDLGSTSEDW